MPETDEQLIERLTKSDEDAFRLLFEKYQPILFRNILHNVRDADAAHDVVQETFIRVWNHRASLRPNASFLAYIFRISRNLVLDEAKHREVRRRLENKIPSGSSSAENPESVTELRMLEEKLLEAVRTLPARCREIFLLSRMEGMSNQEIGAQLGLSVKTVENQITRALKSLHRALQATTK